MEIIILGSGTATPSLHRNASGLVVLTSQLTILVDIGPGTIRRLCEARVDWKAVDAILVTHFHPDHVSDLVPFLFASNYTYGPSREEPFHLIGPNGIENLYAALVKVFGDWIIPTSDRLRIDEMKSGDPDFLQLQGVTIRSVPAAHSSPSLSYRIEEKGESVTISGDTDVSHDLFSLARGTNVFVCECSMPEGRKIPGHLIPSEAGAMAQSANVGRLVLTHMYPPCDEVNVASQASEVFHGRVDRAEDLMRIVV